MKIEEFDLSTLVPENMRPLLEDCKVICARTVLSRFTVHLLGNLNIRRGYRVIVSDPDFSGTIVISLGPGTGRINIAAKGPAHLDIRIWRGGTFHLGSGTTVGNARIVCDNADVVVGEDGLWSDEILIQSNDQHGIVDSTTGHLLNGGRRRIEIGSHVWLGRRSIVMPDVTIGAGTILAAGSILTKDTPSNTIYAGFPAREIRGGVTWSRSPAGMNESELKYLENEIDTLIPEM